MVHRALHCFALVSFVGILFAVGSQAACGIVNGIMCNGGLCESGNCVCPPYLVGPNCKYQCPGPPSSPCSDKGACFAHQESAMCSCAEIFRGLACTIACPIFSGAVCSGRGLCNNSGSCLCNEGFVGSDCSRECSGGAISPCSAHGKCLASGSCLCDNGRTGENCQLYCPSGKNGLICSGRGKSAKKNLLPSVPIKCVISILADRYVLKRNWPVSMHAIHRRAFNIWILWRGL